METGLDKTALKNANISKCLLISTRLDFKINYGNLMATGQLDKMVQNCHKD